MDPSQGQLTIEFEFQARLKKEMTYFFAKQIRPPSLLHVFPAIDPNVLNQVDLERIRASQSKEGDSQAAIVLLDSLVVYKNWFPCLLKVLRHSDVKLNHVAENFERIYEKLHKKYFPELSNPCSTDAYQQQKSSEGLQYEKSETNGEKKGTTAKDPLNTLEIDKATSPNSKTLSSDNTLAPDSPMISQECLESPEDREDGEGQQEEDNKDKPNIPKKPPSKGHGPEYDFSYDETSHAFKNIAGWHKETDEKKIEETLRKLCHEDGHYILWYWERKKRPGVCVTSGKRIKTYIVHKRPGKRGEATQFYIDRNGTSDPSLRALLSHHLEKGISDMSSSGKTIAFLKPVNVKGSE